MKKATLFLICLLGPFIMVLGSEKEKIVNDKKVILSQGTICLQSCFLEADFFSFSFSGDTPPAKLRLFIDGVEQSLPIFHSSGSGSFSLPESYYPPNTSVTLSYYKDGYWHIWAGFNFSACYCNYLPVCAPSYPSCP